MSTGSPKLLWTAISTEGAKCNKLYKGPMIHNVKIMCTYYIYIHTHIQYRNKHVLLLLFLKLLFPVLGFGCMLSRLY